MKKFLLSLFVIFLAYLTAYYTSGASEKQDLFDLGNSTLVYKIKCAVTGETDTTDANALYYRAGSYMDMEEYELALKDYKKVLELDPNIFYARMDMAKTYLKLNDTANAILLYQQHIAISEYPEDAYLELGQLYQKLGFSDSTYYYYNKAVIANPDNNQANYHLAFYYFSIKEYQKALELVNKAISSNQYDLDYRNLRRKTYIKLNQRGLAEEEYQYISSNDPYYFEDYAQKAKEANEEGDYQKAIEYYNLAIEIEESNIELLRGRAWAYHNLMKYDSALMDFKQVAEITPDYYNLFNVAYCLDFLDSIETSIDYYNKSIELKNDYHLAYNNRGYEYFRLKKYKEAIKDYSTCIDIKNDYYLSYYNRGIAYFNQKKYKKAITDYKMAKELTSENKSITYDIALAYDKLKDKDDAVFYFNEYLKVAGTSDTTKINYAIERVAKLSK